MDFTPSELMAVSAARELEDRQVVAVGLGLPGAGLQRVRAG